MKRIKEKPMILIPISFFVAALAIAILNPEPKTAIITALIGLVFIVMIINIKTSPSKRPNFHRQANSKFQKNFRINNN